MDARYRSPWLPIFRSNFQLDENRKLIRAADLSAEDPNLRLSIGREGHLDQSAAWDFGEPLWECRLAIKDDTKKWGSKA